MKIKNIRRFLIKNWFISIFIGCLFFVSIISIYKLFFSRPTYIYAKIKVGQGLWWASTIKPSYWFVNALKNNSEVEKDLTDKPIVKIIDVTYYPTYEPDQYNIYVNTQLLVSRLGNKGYSFNRSTIGVGSPIDIELPSIQFSGTITELSKKPLKDNLIVKTIYLNKRNALSWEFDAIKINDKYFNGKDTIFQILDKNAINTQFLDLDIYGKYPANIEQSQNINVKAKIKVKKINDKYIFGEDQVVNVGKNIYLTTSNYSFNGYIISKIE